MRLKNYRPTTGLLLLLFFGLFGSCRPSYESVELIPWREYAALDLDGPYVLHMDGEEGDLLYYGALHSNRIEDAQMRDIENQWTEFRPTVAYCEGGIWPLGVDRDDAIRRFGEQGLVRFLAERDHVPVRTFDPSLRHQAVYLTGKFTPEKVKIYYMLLHVMITRRHRDLFDADFCIDAALDFASEIPFSGCEPSDRDDFISRMNFYFPEQRDWARVSPVYFHEPEKGKFLAEIHMTLSHFRDRVMLQHLIQQIKRGERVFAVAGRAHVAVQEPVLRAAISE